MLAFRGYVLYLEDSKVFIMAITLITFSMICYNNSSPFDFLGYTPQFILLASMNKETKAMERFVFKVVCWTPETSFRRNSNASQ